MRTKSKNRRSGDDEIMCALIGQVSRAFEAHLKRTPGPITETCVTTIISRPMWRAFNRALGRPEDTEPTPWLGIHETHRVYGSDTRIVESEFMFSFSF